MNNFHQGQHFSGGSPNRRDFLYVDKALKFLSLFLINENHSLRPVANSLEVKDGISWRELCRRPEDKVKHSEFKKFAFLVAFWIALSAISYFMLRLMIITFPANQNIENGMRLDLPKLVWLIVWDRSVISESFWNYDSSPLNVALTILACQTSLLVGVVFAGGAGDNSGQRASAFYSAVSFIQIIAMALALLTPALLIDSAIWAMQWGESGVEMIVTLLIGILVVCMGVLIGDPDLVLGFKEAHLHRRLQRCENIKEVLKEDRKKMNAHKPSMWVLRGPTSIMWVFSVAVTIWGTNKYEQVDVRYSFWIFLSLVVAWTIVAYTTLIHMPFWDAALNYWGAKLVRFSMGASVVLIAAVLAGLIYENWFILIGAILVGAVVIFFVSKLIDIDVRSCSRVQHRWDGENEGRIESIKSQLGDEGRTT